MAVDYSRLILDKTTPLPLYYQIERFLLDEIEEGRLQVGECLPPELEMMEVLGVSRSTVRQAIADMVHQGVLVRHKGKGTFVQKPKVQESALQVLESFHEEMAKKGYKPTTKVLSFSIEPGIPEINEKLGLAESEKLYCLRRTRYVDGEAVLTFRTYLPEKRFPGLMEEDFEQHSLYKRMEERYGCRVNRQARRIEAGLASTEEALLMDIERKSAVFHVAFIGYCGEEPVEYSTTTYRADRVEFVVEVRR